MRRSKISKSLTVSNVCRSCDPSLCDPAQPRRARRFCNRGRPAAAHRRRFCSAAPIRDSDSNGSERRRLGPASTLATERRSNVRNTICILAILGSIGTWESHSDASLCSERSGCSRRTANGSTCSSGSTGHLNVVAILFQTTSSFLILDELISGKNMQNCVHLSICNSLQKT